MDVEDGKAGRKKIRKSLFATGATQLSNSSVRIVGKSISTSVLTVVPRPHQKWKKNRNVKIKNTFYGKNHETL